MKGKIRLDGRSNSLTKIGYPIIFYLTQDSREKPIGTGYYSHKEHWDAGNALPTSKHPNYIPILNYLEIAKIRLAKLIAMSMRDRMTFEQAKRFLVNATTGNFYEDAMMYLQHNDMHSSYRLAIESFDKVYPGAPYEFVTEQMAQKFARKLLLIPTHLGERSPNGVNAYLTRLGYLWRQCSDKRSPFKGVRVKARETANKSLLEEDLVKLRAADFKKHYNVKYGGVQNYINYWLLCFYLGGIDLVDLVSLTTDNIIGDRIEFKRAKGNSSVLVSNKIFPEAAALLDFYKGQCRNLLVPVERQNLIDFHTSIHKRQDFIKDGLQLSRKLYSKSARYTFVNRSMNLLIDERICAEIVGHKEQSTHSIYKGRFPDSVRDAAHWEIIKF